MHGELRVQCWAYSQTLAYLFYNHALAFHRPDCHLSCKDAQLLEAQSQIWISYLQIIFSAISGINLFQDDDAHPMTRIIDLNEFKFSFFRPVLPSRLCGLAIWYCIASSTTGIPPCP